MKFTIARFDFGKPQKYCFVHITWADNVLVLTNFRKYSGKIQVKTCST